MRRHHRDEPDDDDSSSSSDEENDKVERRQKKKKRKSSSKKHKKRDDEEDDRRRSRKQKKEKKKDHKKQKRRKRSSSSDSSDSDDDSEDSRPKKKRKEKRREKKGHHDDDGSKKQKSLPNPTLTERLYDLVSNHAAFAEELPIILIQLAGGTCMNLSQMTDQAAAARLAAVLHSLQQYGLELQDESWVWTGPKQNAELVLVKVVRTLMDQEGVTMEAVEAFEKNKCQRASLKDDTTTSKDQEVSTAEAVLTRKLLKDFGTELASEIVGLCGLILEGESIALDGIPNENLRQGLEELFTHCGLEKAEMEASDDEEEDGEQEPTMGYALPETAAEACREAMLRVLKVCKNPTILDVPDKTTTAKPARRPISGPVRETEAQLDDNSDSDSEGPALPGQARLKGPSLPPELLKAKAEQRTRELESIKTGVAAPVDHQDGPVREEWMLTPGKYDFLGDIKAGQPLRNRKFGAQSKADREPEQKAVDPSVQAEIDAIMRAHEEARGPSLLEIHRQTKMEANRGGGESNKSWKWARDKDLDAGRRVDKNALNMILGGASKDLKSKFHGGLN